MANLRNVARITTDKHGGGGSIPKVTGEDLNINAWLIWQSVHEQLSRAETKRRRNHEDGYPGFLWEGSLSSVIRDLWPALSGGYFVSNEEANEIRSELSRWLRRTRNMVNLDKGVRKVRRPAWWISENWAEMTVIPIQAETTKTTELVSESPVEDPEDTHEELDTQDQLEQLNVVDHGGESGEYNCRVCTRSFAYAGVRALHERGHNIRVLPDGTVVELPTKSLTDDELNTILIAVIRQAEKPISHPVIYSRAIMIDPRVPRDRSNDAIKQLSYGPNQRLHAIRGDRGGTYYYPVERPMSGGTDEAKPEKPKVTITSTTPTESAPIPVETTTAMTVTTVENDVVSQTRLGRHVPALEALLSDLRDLASDEGQLLALQNHLRTTTADRDNLAKELAETRELLRVVTAERDALNQRLINIRRNLLIGDDE